MDKFFDSRKYMIILIVICLTFALIIIKAYDYLPDEEIGRVGEIPIEEQTNNPVNTDESEQNKVVTENKKPQKHGILYKSTDEELDGMTFDEIKAPKDEIDAETTVEEKKTESQLSSDELLIKSLFNTKKLLSNKEYSIALNEYKNIIESTQDNIILADCYDGMAEIYAKEKRYGTALTYANMANKASPSLSREFIIAKIYYNSGNIDDAINRVNNILKRNF